MANPKYKLTDETVRMAGKKLYRIQALRDFVDVKSGDLGGFVESEKNLSQDGNCWVAGDAKVSGNARVFGNAQVYDKAEVYGDARLFGNAKVYSNAEVYDKANVYDKAEVYCASP